MDEQQMLVPGGKIPIPKNYSWIFIYETSNICRNNVFLKKQTFKQDTLCGLSSKLIGSEIFDIF